MSQIAKALRADLARLKAERDNARFRRLQERLADLGWTLVDFLRSK